VSTDLGEPQLAVLVTDCDKWRARKVIGRKMINGEIHSRMDWGPIWELEAELGSAEELINEYLARLKNV
jgi:hypothetical protein